MKSIFTLIMTFFFSAALYSQNLFLDDENDYSIVFGLEEKPGTSVLYEQTNTMRYEKSEALYGSEKSDFFDDESDGETDIEEPPFKIGIFGGPSYFLGKIKDGPLHDFKEDMRLGFHIRGELNIYFTKYFGAGLKLGYSHAYNANIFQDLSSNIDVTFVGLSFCFQTNVLNPLSNIFATVSVGALRYEESTNFLGEWNNVAGRTLGGHFDLGYEYTITSYFAVGLHTSFMLGTLRKVRTDKDSGLIRLAKSDVYDLNRLDLSLVFRFSF